MEISKEKKQAYADKYFGGMNCKELREFKSVTPKGHQINGYICNKHNYYLGSLLILKVDGEETEQFIQSFPKIKYYENYRQLDPVKKEHYCFEKLDGSCLIIYPLIVNNTEIEYVPKTRGMAVADKQFLDLFNRLDHSKLDQYYSMYKFDILVFELSFFSFIFSSSTLRVISPFSVNFVALLMRFMKLTGYLVKI